MSALALGVRACKQGRRRHVVEHLRRVRRPDVVVPTACGDELDVAHALACGAEDRVVDRGVRLVLRDVGESGGSELLDHRVGGHGGRRAVGVARGGAGCTCPLGGWVRHRGRIARDGAHAVVCLVEVGDDERRREVGRPLAGRCAGVVPVTFGAVGHQNGEAVVDLRTIADMDTDAVTHRGNVSVVVDTGVAGSAQTRGQLVEHRVGYRVIPPPPIIPGVREG